MATASRVTPNGRLQLPTASLCDVDGAGDLEHRDSKFFVDDRTTSGSTGHVAVEIEDLESNAWSETHRSSAHEQRRVQPFDINSRRDADDAEEDESRTVSKFETGNGFEQVSAAATDDAGFFTASKSNQIPLHQRRPVVSRLTSQPENPIDLPECRTVRRRVSKRSRSIMRTIASMFGLRFGVPYPRLVHPLDKGLFLSFAISIVYLAAAVVSFCPTLGVVVVVLPVAILVRRAVATCTKRRTPNEPAEDVDAADVGSSSPLTGHEEFWVGQRSAVTQCLVVFDGRLDVAQMRQLIESRLINRNTATNNGDRSPASFQNSGEFDRGQVSPNSTVNAADGHRWQKHADGDRRRRGGSSKESRSCSRFLQKLVRSSAVGSKWTVDRNFDIANHVISAPPGVANSAEDLRRFVSQMADRKLSWERPLWELHVIESPLPTSPLADSAPNGDDVTTLALLRLHPAMSDGVKLVRLLCCRLADDDEFLTSGSGWRSAARCHYGRLAYTFNIVRAMFVGLLLLLKKLVTFNDRNILHPFTSRRTGITVVSWSRPVSMSSTLRVKDVTRSTLNDLLLAALSGSLRHYLLAVGVANPSDMTATLLIDLQPHETSPPPQQMQQSLGPSTTMKMASQSQYSYAYPHPQANWRQLQQPPTAVAGSDERRPSGPNVAEGFPGNRRKLSSGRWTTTAYSSAVGTSVGVGVDGPYGVTGVSQTTILDRGHQVTSGNLTVASGTVVEETMHDACVSLPPTAAGRNVSKLGVAVGVDELDEEFEDDPHVQQTESGVYVVSVSNPVISSKNGILPPPMAPSEHLTGELHQFRMQQQPVAIASRRRHQQVSYDITSDVKLSLVDVTLPTNTEGAIPRLWDMKQRMNEVKSSSDHVVLYVFQTILQYLLPECIRRRLWPLFYCRSTILISNLPGPDYAISLAGKQVRDAMFWFPPLDGAAISISFLTYAGQLYMTVAADSGALPDPDYVTTSFVAEMEKLSKLLAHRRIPGEHSLRRRSDRSGIQPIRDPDDINEIQARISEVQKQLRELEISLEMDPDQELSEDESRLVEQLESLKVEFSEMLFELRHKLNVHVAPDAINDDDYEDDGVLRPQYRRLSLHSAAVSSRGLLSAMSVSAARMLHVPTTNSPPPGASTPWAADNAYSRRRSTAASASSAGGSEIDLDSVDGGGPETDYSGGSGAGIPRKYHSFHRPMARPTSSSYVGRARLSLDCGMTSSPAAYMSGSGLVRRMD